MTRGAEYVTDVPYVRSFAADLSPTRLRLVAALNGFPSPDAEDFDYCELGAAHGDTTATLAAAYPRARFVGVDLLPQHIAVARALATDGGLANVRFLERDFEDLGREDLPDFDYLCAHGVLSWIGPTKRRALLAFASAKLRPGGLLYVGYNALPGWAAVEPLRRLLLDRAAAVPGGTLEAAARAVELAKALRDAGAEYFAANPHAKAMLAEMEKRGLPYVAHEYLNAHWIPMYFAEVAREMADHDLYFVGQLPLFLNYRDLAIPASMAPLFKDVGDRVTFESLMDFALNQFFRRDVYIKGRAARSESTTHAYLEATPFGPLEAGAIARRIRLPHHTLDLVGSMFEALLPALADGAATVVSLAQRPDLAIFGAPRIRDAMLRLAIGDLVSPFLRPTHAAPTKAAARYHVPSAYNRMLLERPLSSTAPTALASSVAGTGIPLSMLHAIALRVLTEVPPEGRAEWIQSLLERQSFRLRIGDRTLGDEEDPVQAMLGEVDAFRAKRLAKLVELGIVETT